ncbi:MAG: hypothetical protein A3F11_06080 [Gammaproteobacteria bacterium RIFCSPHIGHO2_12_FULL_37_14]|nr:MAG: hypothetical protein A3F11_06080 [Gammaproteobacteria bacterium RIFCSPHIGHO2_12_FULL_37_14]
MANSRIVDSHLESITDNMVELIQKFQIKISECQHIELKNFLEMKIQDIFQLMIPNPESCANVANEFCNLNLAIKKEALKIKKLSKNQKRIIDEFKELLSTLQKLILCKGRFEAKLNILNENAEVTQSTAIAAINNEFAEYQALYARYQSKTQEMQIQYKNNIIGVAQRIIQEQLTSCTAKAIYLKSCEQLDILTGVFLLRLDDTKAGWPHQISEYYAAFQIISETLGKEIEILKNNQNVLAGFYFAFYGNILFSQLEEFIHSCTSYAKKLQNLENSYRTQIAELENVYTKEIKQMVEKITVEAQPFLMKIDAITSEYQPLTEEKKNIFFRSVQNNSEIKLAMSHFSRECHSQMDLINNGQIKSADAIAKSLSDMQVFRKDMDDIFNQLLSELELANPTQIHFDKPSRMTLRQQLIDRQTSLTNNWDKQIQLMSELSTDTLDKMHQSDVDIAAIPHFCEGLREHILLIAKTELVALDKLAASQYQALKYHELLESNKKKAGEFILSNINEMLVRPAQKLDFLSRIHDLKYLSLGSNNKNVYELIDELTQQLNSLKPSTREYASSKRQGNHSTLPIHSSVYPNVCPSYSANQKKLLKKAFFYRLFANHWKAMSIIGLLAAIIFGTVFTGGMLSSAIVGIVGGTSFLASVMNSSLGIAAVVGSVVTTSSSTSVMIGSTVISLLAGVVAGLKAGILITMMEKDEDSIDANLKTVVETKEDNQNSSKANQSKHNSHAQIKQNLHHVPVVSAPSDVKEEKSVFDAIPQSMYILLGLFWGGYVNSARSAETSKHLSNPPLEANLCEKIRSKSSASM